MFIRLILAFSLSLCMIISAQAMTGATRPDVKGKTAHSSYIRTSVVVKKKHKTNSEL